MQKLSAAVFRECVTSGGDIAAFLNLLIKAPASQPTSDLMCGALAELLSVYQSIRSAGHVARFADKELDGFMHGTANYMALIMTMKLNPVDSVWLSKHLSELVAVVHAHREKLSFKAVEPKPAPEPPPLVVQIVSMPDRVVASKVAYDKEGNVTSTSQIESDASASAA
jgi:hypothetical protein